MKKKNKGFFIVVDGSDGAGKKTQSDIMIDRLKKKGYEVAYYDFPQYGETLFGDMVGRYLDGEFGGVNEVNPYLTSILYAGDRFQASEAMKKDLAAGKIVICNRYVQSNMGFQTAKIKDLKEKKKFLLWLEKLEYEIFKIPKPDLVIYLYLPYKVSQEFVCKKDARSYTKKKQDIHEENADFLQAVEKEYLSLAKDNQEWVMIDCVLDNRVLSIEEVAEKIAIEKIVEQNLRLNME